ncbi:MAG: hypothetical protein AVDCRST_MAG11-117 [uncultured Gemmatimonadaceae bacterium]|uniref:Uncharacterized protein n=1 Tax=uncultured Gemmatimonadaceae bacterium TaxID=246130 RepID=A0A6J4JZ50_9BACT|nr:MAG: hypothetical protein AVDCRST_MAG11-117 [uncultured Gemmatimonadaceae bacterium]
MRDRTPPRMPSGRGHSPVRAVAARTRARRVLTAAPPVLVPDRPDPRSTALVIALWVLHLLVTR